MHVSIGERWEGFVKDAVKDGHFGSASEVMIEGLRLVEERQAKLQALRDMIEASITRGGSNTDDEVGARIEALWQERQNANNG